MDAILADGASLESFEDDLRRTISSPEERSTPLGRTWWNLVQLCGTLRNGREFWVSER